MVDPRELAQRIERADKGRVFVRYRRISDCGGQAIAPLVLVGVAKGGAPIIPSVEKIDVARDGRATRSEEQTSELQSRMRISYAVFCLKKKKTRINIHKAPRHNEGI